jgi:hypothetical protein
MKIRETTAIIGVVLGTMLVMSGVGLTNTILVNKTLAAAPGNMTNATNAMNPGTVVQKGTTSSNDVKTTTTNNNITLGNPFYIEYDKIRSQVPGIPLNGGGHATGVTFSGNGTVKGIGFTDTGRALIVPISKTTADIFGGVAIKANVGGGNSTLSFRELVHMTPAGTMQGSGAAIFNANSTRNLSFLGNTVAMFTDTGNKGSTDTIKAWEWKYR